MRQVNITEEQVERARNWYEFGALPQSIMEGRSNIYGALGEVIFSDLYPDWYRIDTTDADFQHDVYGTVDVKTKRTTAVPRPHWNCSVAATSLHQQCDLWFFLRVHESLRTAWVLGWLRHDELFERGVFRRKGEFDGAGWQYKADCWNVRVDKLNPVKMDEARPEGRPVGLLPASTPWEG